MTDIQASTFDKDEAEGEASLEHIGIIRKSGRYPWGSGSNPYQRSMSFIAMVDDLKSKGLSETDIAKSMGITVVQLRANRTIAKNEKRAADESTAKRLRDEGNSNVAIGNEMGINESSVRSLLNPSTSANRQVLESTADVLRDNVDSKGFIDIGAGNEHHILEGSISRDKFNTAVAMLEDEGYTVHTVKIPTTIGNETTVKVLAPPGTEWKDVAQGKDNIRSITEYSEDGGRTFLGIEPPVAVNPKRVDVRYADEGGADRDGVIELRRGVDDISLGNSRYAQVRIQVGDDKYLKGMAMYSDDMPEGVDILFNTNKKSTGNKLDAMKPLKKVKENVDGKMVDTDETDPDNPFGSIVRQRHYTDKSGKSKLSPLNIVGTEDPDGLSAAGEEGAWSKWSSKLSSQMLSKQPPSLAQEQLDLTYRLKKEEFDEINSLTNPEVKKKLLDSFADDADSSAVHLKAAGLPRTANHVILPINSLKDTEIYAPNYRDGERVVLIRHPHGGTFEIPELTVNNRNREANRLIKQAADAVGINSKVAGRLSGADFDGDTVLVIPQGSKRKVTTRPPLEGLKDFDPQTSYPGFEGMKVMSNKQRQMGDISNLITDMTIQGANEAEIAKAVKHSMVVIDAEKHKLNYKQSAVDNGISQLKTKYQGGPTAGASTLISQAKGVVRVNERKDRSAAKGGPIDPKTGRRMYEETGRTYTVTKTNKRTGMVTTEVIPRVTKTTKMAEAINAHRLSSKPGTEIEAVYANHANRLKALANDARKTSYNTKSSAYSPSARTAYAKEVSTLSAKLNVALKNAPLERQAQVVANSVYRQKRKANPEMDGDEQKKIKSQALAAARARTGANKQRVNITPREWEAVQAGAISNSRLRQILTHTDLDTVKALATPRTATVMTSAKMRRAEAMLRNGVSQADIADALGVPTSTLSDALGR